MLTDRAWKRLVTDGHVAEVLDHGEPVNKLADRIRDLQLAPAPAVESPDMAPSIRVTPQQARTITARSRALTAWAVRYAEAGGRVERWRRMHLRDGLLTHAAAETWMAEHATDDAGRTLSMMTSDLSRRLRWHPTAAALWVLTGETPRTMEASWSYRGRNEMAVGLPWCKAFTTVDLHLDPALTPEQVAAVWADVRRRITQGRYKSAEERAYRIAAWVAPRWPGDGETWEDWRRAWNAEHPDDQMADQRIFRRTVMRAVEGLLRPPWKLSP